MSEVWEIPRLKANTARNRRRQFQHVNRCALVLCSLGYITKAQFLRILKTAEKQYEGKILGRTRGGIHKT